MGFLDSGRVRPEGGRPRTPPPPLTVLPDEGEAQLVLVAGPLPRLLAEALEEVGRHAADGRVRVHRGQDPEVVAQQPVQHEQGQRRPGGIGVDHDVLQRPVVLGSGRPPRAGTPTAT